MSQYLSISIFYPYMTEASVFRQIWYARKALDDALKRFDESDIRFLEFKNSGLPQVMEVEGFYEYPD